MTAFKKQELQFSIQGERAGTWLKPIPWKVIAPHEVQAMINHGGQTLARLHERGGLDPREALCCLLDRPLWGEFWIKLTFLTIDEVNNELRQLVAVREHLLAGIIVPCTHGPQPEALDHRGMMKCPQCGTLVNGFA